MKYKLPNKNHAVVDDIIQLAKTFCEIDSDILSMEVEVSKAGNSVEELSAKAIGSNIKNSEISEIAPNRFLTVNEYGSGFVCVDGGGALGGKTAQCCFKKSDKDFDMAYANIFDILKNGTKTQSNVDDGEAGNFHIFCDEIEIENDEQLPKSHLKNKVITNDFESEANDAVFITNEIEPFYKTTEFATKLNYGTVKIGDGISVNGGEISSKEIKTACKTRLGIVKPGSGMEIENGVFSACKTPQASKDNYGTIKIGAEFQINEDGAIELADMADAAIIYKLNQSKSVVNGNVDLEEKTLIYRAVVTEDLIFSFNIGFIPRNDFTFILEIISDGEHIINFADQVKPVAQTMPINRGTTKIYFTKKLGLSYYEATVSKLEAPSSKLLTPANGLINNNFVLTAPEGSTWHPHRLLRDYYDGFCNCSKLQFKFETLVCVEYVKYWSKTSTTAMNEFSLKGSNDGKNWTTLIYKNNEIIYGKIYTEIKGCFRYFEVSIGYTTDDNKPGGVTLWGTETDNNESELTAITSYQTSNIGTNITLTGSNLTSGSIANITNDTFNDYLSITADTNGNRWVKYEIAEAKVANILQILIGSSNASQQATWFKLEGSNDNENWTLLLERQYQAQEILKNFNVLYYEFNNETAYKYYRLTCLGTNSSNATWLLDGFMLYNRSRGKNNIVQGIPKLSAATQDGYEVTASSQYSESFKALFAFDKDSTTRWAAAVKTDSWLQIKLPTAMICNVVTMSALCNGSPNTWKVQGSNDNEIWTTIETFSNVVWSSDLESKSFDFKNEIAYLYYRINIITGNGTNHLTISEVNLGKKSYDYKRLLNKYDSIVPKLLSDNEQGYKVSASSIFSGSTHYAYKAFDNGSGESNKWLSSTNDISNAWLKIELPIEKIANAFFIQIPAERYTERSPKDFKIEASNDDKSWTKLVMATNMSWTNNQARTFTCENETAYKFYRIYITATNGGNIVHIGEWKLYYNNLIEEY